MRFLAAVIGAKPTTRFLPTGPMRAPGWLEKAADENPRETAQTMTGSHPSLARRSWLQTRQHGQETIHRRPIDRIVTVMCQAHDAVRV